MSKRAADEGVHEPPAKKQKTTRRVGVIGFGKVGAFLVENILNDGKIKGLDLAFVCDLGNPSNVMDSDLIPVECKAKDMEDFERFNADLIVEVAHPAVSKTYGPRILKSCDYLIASTTTFADAETEAALLEEARTPTGHGIYLTAGALYGAHDIQKMSNAGKLASLQITMKKHPDSLYPREGTKEHALNEKAKGEAEEVLLYEGPARALAGVFPVNVNTICTAAIAASSSLGMDGTVARLVADSRLEEMVIEVKAAGPTQADGRPGLRITTLRENPSKRGEVTGQATLNSFYSSLLRVATRAPLGDGLHLA